MFRKIATLLTVLGALAFLTNFLFKYIPYRQLALSSPLHPGLSQFQLVDRSNSTQKFQLLKHLNQLTKIPLIGFLFDDQKIEELIRLQKYQECIKQSQIILQKYFYQRSFTIWFYKAVAECRLLQRDACQGSLNKATLYSRGYLQKWRIQNLHKYIQTVFFGASKVQASFQEDQQTRRQNINRVQEMKLKSLQEL